MQSKIFFRTTLLGLVLLFSFAPDAFVKARKRSRPNASSWYLLNRNVRQTDGRQVRTRLTALLARPKVRLFLNVVQKAEGGAPNLMVGGCRAKTLKQHPAVTLPRRCRYPIRYRGARFSTAAGKYQLTHTNWKRIAPFLRLPTFSEVNQELAVLELLRRGGGAADATSSPGRSIKRRIQQGFLDLINGNVSSALCKATYDFASSSCSPLPARRKVDYARMARKMPKPQRKYARRRVRASQSS